MTRHRRTGKALQYLFSAFLVALATALRLAMGHFFGTTPPFVTYYPAVILAVLVFDRGPALFALALSGLTAAYLFLEPLYSFKVEALGDTLALLFFFIAGFFLAIIAHRLSAAKVERAQRESEARLDRFYESGLLGVIYWNMDGKILDANQKFLEMVGYTREELDAGEIDWVTITPSQYRRLDEQSAEELRATGVNSKPYEKEYVRKDGMRVPVIVASAMLDDARFDGVAFVLDIGERKRAEEALKRSEHRFRILFNGLTDAVFVHRVSGNLPGRFVEVNDAACRRLGYSREELLGMTPRDIDAPEGRLAIEPVMDQLMAGNQATWEGMHQAKDGRKIPVEIRSYLFEFEGEPAVLSTARDITRRKALEEERAKLWSAVERAGEGVFMLTPDRRYSYVNAAFCKAYGYSPEELMGRETDMLRSDRHPPSLHDSLWSELRAGNTWSGRQTRKRKDGALIEVQTTIVPVRDASGAIIHFVGVERDVTEQLQIEAQLRHAQKMEAIGTLAGGVAHDFNNILTVIIGLANLIQMSLGKDDRNRPYIDQIILSSERAADLTQSLLAYSRKQRITLEPHQVAGVVESTAKLLKRLLPEDIELKLDLGDGNAVALLDVVQMDQVLMNLATNARDAMPHGGSLVVRTETTTLDETFRRIHGFGKPGAYVRLSVSDTGVGMDEKTMARIFDPFFTTKEVGKGTGLGLASAYGIVKQHDGYITVTSGLFKGTTFDVYLPLVEMAGRREAAAAAGVRGGSETLLVLEDDPGVRSMLTKILSDQGYAILEAADGDDAIRVFGEHKDAIGLVILDVVVPGKNGKEVLDEITRIDSRVRAIFMSGHTGDIVIDKGVQKDRVDFLQKPLSVEKLLAKVREVLDR